MNKSLQIALLVVMMGIALSAALTKAQVTAITPKKADKVGDVSIVITLVDGTTVAAGDIISFSTDITKAGTGDLAHTVIANDVTTKSITKTFKFATTGNYTCIASRTGSSDSTDGVFEQTDIVIEVAGKFLSVSMIIGALFLLF